MSCALFIFTLFLQVLLLNAQTLNIAQSDVFSSQQLTEVVSVFFSNDGYSVSGRKVTRNNVNFHPGVTQETGYRNGGLTFGRGTTGFFSVDGIDMRDPLNFINCPEETLPSANVKKGVINVCCKFDPSDRCTIGNTRGQMNLPPMGLMVRMRINFGSFSKICWTCDDPTAGENDFTKSSTCTNSVGELAVSAREHQTLFSVPVEGKPDNLKFTIKREQIFASEHNNGCTLSQLYYTFTLRDSDGVLSTWKVFKYHKLWLEDGNDHTFTLTIPRLPEFTPTSTAFPLLYIDGQYICAEPFVGTPVVVTKKRDVQDTQDIAEDLPNNDCCTEAATTGCSDPKAEACICKNDGWCCFNSFDSTCAAHLVDDDTFASADVAICLAGYIVPCAVPKVNVVHCLDKKAEGDALPLLPQEINNQKCSLTRLYLGNSPSTWSQETLGASGQASNFRSYTGLQGATFKSFQMWNYQGIPEPANTRLCGEKNSAQCSFYTNKPVCKNASSKDEWQSLVPALQEKKGCPVTTPPTCVGLDGSGTTIGTATNCRFLGDSCGEGKTCCKPGVCCIKVIEKPVLEEKTL